MVLDSAGCQMQFLPFAMLVGYFQELAWLLNCFPYLQFSSFLCAVVGDGDIHPSYWVMNLQP